MGSWWRRLYHAVYALGLQQAVALALCAGILFCILDRRFGKRPGTRALWAGAWAAMAVLILTATVFSRQSGESGLILRPFAAFAQAKAQPEVYRELLMNVLLFFPLGLAGAAALPERLRPGLRWALAALAGMLLSLAVEGLQYRLSLGLAETDDVLCNTLGALLGGGCLPLSRWLQKKTEQSRPAG